MKCPNCGENLWFIKDVCPFCKKPTKKEASSAASSGLNPQSDLMTGAESGETLITLTRCESISEADLLASQLEGAGIEAFLPDESLMQNAAWQSTYGYVRVQVRQKDLAAAQHVLANSKEIPKADTAPLSEENINLANLPLSRSMKWFTFATTVLTCPSFIIFAATRNAYLRQGCDRKATELAEWYWGSILFWIFLWLGIMLLAAIIK